MMNKTMNTGNRFLDVFKRILVKFRDAGFGVKLILLSVPPNNSTNSSLTILITCCPGVKDFNTS